MKKETLNEIIEKIAEKYYNEYPSDNKASSTDWKYCYDESPEDEQDVLVSWRDGEENWKGPILAYYCEKDCEYYALDTPQTIPINAEIWCPIQPFPED